MRRALFATFAVLATSACGTTPPTPDSQPAAELEADVCAVTQSFSALIRAKETAAPPSVLLAHADAWFDLAYAYDVAKADLTRCIDPELGAVIQSGAEVWPGYPPLSATKKFDAHDTGSFTDKPNDAFGPHASLSSIRLETITTDTGAELRMSLQ